MSVRVMTEASRISPSVVPIVYHQTSFVTNRNTQSLAINGSRNLQSVEMTYRAPDLSSNTENVGDVKAHSRLQ